MLEVADLVKDATEGPDVRFIRVRLVLVHLGGHVIWSPDTLILARNAYSGGEVHSGVQTLGNPEVPVDQSLSLYKNILGLQIPMKDFLVMEVMKTEGKLGEPLVDNLGSKMKNLKLHFLKNVSLHSP